MSGSTTEPDLPLEELELAIQAKRCNEITQQLQAFLGGSGLLAQR